ncbi:MAG: FadR family transcriptional regulator [Lachnospiraceae bacterium]|jgi:GntR family transcriptional repressor for pyruvate dehydrogenase complex|nr:FadR family transcriptional regulator [Lachnospiraceae bacterium]
MRTTGQTRVEKSSEDILQYIKDHNLTAGDKLPTEMELSKLLGVGRNTVREALRLLLSRNIVVIRQGAGSFVSDKNGVSDDPLGFFMVDDRKKLIEDLLQARVIIEPQIAAIAAQNRTEEELARLEDALKNVEQAMTERSNFSVEDEEFHTCIANCTHNNVIAELIPVITKGIVEFSSGVKKQEYQQTLVSHRNIFIAIRDKKPIEASQAMGYHLLYNQNRYLQEL